MLMKNNLYIRLSLVFTLFCPVHNSGKPDDCSRNSCHEKGLRHRGPRHNEGMELLMRYGKEILKTDCQHRCHTRYNSEDRFL